MKRRILAVTLAALLAVLGAVAVLAYVRQANNRAVAGLRTETVMVAKGAIPAGTRVSQAQSEGLVTSQKFPIESLPADPVYSLGSGQAGLVIDSALQPGSILLKSMLVSTAQYTGSTNSGLAVPPGQMAVTVQVCLSSDVAGYVQPGARVSVFNTYGLDQPLQYTCSNHEPPKKAVTHLVLTNVKVLAVSAASSSTQSTGVTAGLAAADTTNIGTLVANQGQVLVTIAVTKDQAEQLIVVGNAFLPTFGLLAAGYVPPPDNGIGTTAP